MEDEQKEIITKNLVYLTDNTADLPKIFIHLVGCNALSDDSRQIINSKTTNTEKVYETYIQVMKKPVFRELLEILDKTKNNAVANVLRGACQKENLAAGSSARVRQNENPTVGSSAGVYTDDFPISDDHFVPIKKILEDMENLEHDWLQVLYGLKIKVRSRNDIKRLSDSNAKFGTVILETLSYWHTDLAEKATFRQLVEVIRECHPLAASELNKNAERIRNS